MCGHTGAVAGRGVGVGGRASGCGGLLHTCLLCGLCLECLLRLEAVRGDVLPRAWWRFAAPRRDRPGREEPTAHKLLKVVVVAGDALDLLVHVLNLRLHVHLLAVSVGELVACLRHLREQCAVDCEEVLVLGLNVCKVFAGHTVPVGERGGEGIWCEVTLSFHGGGKHHSG